MQTALAVLPYLIVLSMVAVLVVLFAGLFTMARGGEANKRHGNKLMRWRVGTQATAIVLIAIYFLLTRMI
jgi:hypothetical protein